VNRDVAFEYAAGREGHPDNAAPAVYGGLVLYAGFPKRLEFHPDLGVALAVPEQTLSTQAARGILPSQLPRQDTIAQASRSAALLVGLTRGDGELIGYGMVDHVAVPARKSLIRGYEAAVQAGLDAGAYGVTISGAGATLVAICERRITRAVAAAVAAALTAKGNPAQPLCPDVVVDGLQVLGGDEED
jgi:homoserine kinase